jgi:uncharacterized membrane protein
VTSPHACGSAAALPPRGRISRLGAALRRSSLCPRVTIAATLALALLEVLWESILAPLAGHPSWLALKALPLALLLPGTMRGARRPRQWLALLLPFYVAEALARAIAERERHAFVAATACIVATIAFVALLGWFRDERCRAASKREYRPRGGQRSGGAASVGGSQKRLRQREYDALDDA